MGGMFQGAGGHGGGPRGKDHSCFLQKIWHFYAYFDLNFCSQQDEQVFSPKSWKNFGIDSCCRFQEKRKNHFLKMASQGPETISYR